MKTASYIYFRFIEYYKDENNINRQRLYAFIGLGALIVFNLLTITMFLDTFFNTHISRFGLGENAYLNRFIKIPLLISPVFIILWFVYWKNRRIIEHYLIDFKTIPKENKMKMDIVFWVYVIGTCLSVLLIAISPVFLNHK